MFGAKLIIKKNKKDEELKAEDTEGQTPMKTEKPVTYSLK